MKRKESGVRLLSKQFIKSTDSYQASQSLIVDEQMNVMDYKCSFLVNLTKKEEETTNKKTKKERNKFQFPCNVNIKLTVVYLLPLQLMMKNETVFNI